MKNSLFALFLTVIFSASAFSSSWKVHCTERNGSTLTFFQSVRYDIHRIELNASHLQFTFEKNQIETISKEENTVNGVYSSTGFQHEISFKAPKLETGTGPFIFKMSARYQTKDSHKRPEHRLMLNCVAQYFQ
jgi:hypothetical protein